MVRRVAGSSSLVLAGLALFVLAGSGALSVLFLRTTAPRTVLLLGTVALVVGVGITLLAITHTSAAAFFVGTAIAGAGFGAAFQGALRTVLPLADAEDRAGVLSLLYVVSYLALGLPAVIAGFLVVHGGGVLPTARGYWLTVMALAAFALLGVIRPVRRHAPGPRAVTPPRATTAWGARRVLSSSVPDEQGCAVMMSAGCFSGRAARDDGSAPASPMEDETYSIRA
jgi:MFS family permease